MITRREFVLFSAVALGTSAFGAVGTSQAFADGAQDNQTGSVLNMEDSYGRGGSLVRPVSKVLPMGCFAQSIVYSMDPDLIIWETIGMSLEEKAKYAFMCHGKESGGDAFVANVGSDARMAQEPRLLLDVGWADKCSTAALASIEEQVSAPALFYCGEFEELPSTFRDLGTALNSDDSAEQAAYLEAVVSLIKSRSEAMAAKARKQLYVAFGPVGIEAQSFNYYQKNMLDYLNAECINAEVGGELIYPGQSQTAVLSLEKLVEINPDAIVFKGVSRAALYNKATPAGGFWRHALGHLDGHLSFAPKTEFSWLDSPLVAQTIGIVWLAKELHPDVFSDVDVAEFAQRFYSLFVHCELPKSTIEAIISGEEGVVE